MIPIDLSDKVAVITGGSGALGRVMVRTLAEAGASDAHYWRKVPMQRRGTAQEIANTVLFLASDLASYITGAYIPVGGGNVMPTI